jgi:hypothetical protein
MDNAPLGRKDAKTSGWELSRWGENTWIKNLTRVNQPSSAGQDNPPGMAAEFLSRPNGAKSI